MDVRPACWVVLVCAAGFVGLEIPANLFYPGGTWWDTSARGVRFWQNFLCDLEWRVALNGIPNPLGSRFAEAAMLVLTLGYGAFWLVVGRLFVGRSRLAVAVAVLGVVSATCIVAVALMPSERFGILHALAVIGAGVPGLTAAATATGGLLTSRRWLYGRLGASMLAFALVDFLLYVAHVAAKTQDTPLSPALQKVAVLLLVAWMVAVALRVLRDATETRRAP